MVKLKLAFMEWFFYNLVIVIKLYKTWYLNLDKALSFPRNQTICQKNWKLWRAPTTTKFNILLNFCTHFLRINVYKSAFDIFFILFTSWVINNNIKNECVETRSFFFFVNNSRSKQNKKIANTPLEILVSRKRVRSFKKKHWLLR